MKALSLTGRKAEVVADAMVTTPKTMSLEATIGQAKKAFEDVHVHMLLLTERGKLHGTVIRDDLQTDLGDHCPVRYLARRRDRVTRLELPLALVHRAMIVNGVRRLAVVDDNDMLLGLLCLKKSLAGFCSNRDVTARSTERSLPALFSQGET